MFLRLFFIFSICICSSIAISAEPIVVQLATESTLAPLYLAPASAEKADFDPSYIQKLIGILRFDLQNNGMTYLVKNTPEADALAGSLNIPDLWCESGVSYVAKAEISGKELSLRILDVCAKGLQTSPRVTLTGDLAQDRRLVHRLVDGMHQALFNEPGIASTKIMFTVKTRSQDGSKVLAEVWESDYDGANARVITKAGAFCVTPVYIPPKSGYSTGGFLYTSYRNGQPKIYAASLKDGVGKRIISMRGNQLMPAITRQRNKIAFISDVTGNPDLFVQEFNPDTGAVGKPYQVFSAKQATQSSPVFCPGGKRIAFVSDKDGAPKIYLIHIPEPGTSLKEIKAELLTKRNRESSAPSWSPDGSKLAYCARTGGERQIWVYDFNTKQERQITQGPGHKENPSWAPNSLHLVYNSSDGELYLTPVNGGDAMKISAIPGDKKFPNWNPGQ